MSKLLSTFLVLSVLVLPFAGAMVLRYLSLGQEIALRTFSSQDELESFILTSLKRGEANRLIGPSFGFDITSGARAMPQGVFGAAKEGAPQVSADSATYSTTNIQVSGVDEADIVKTDGKYVYSVSGTRFLIVEAFPAKAMKLVSETEVNGTILGLFVRDDRLVVLEQSTSTYPKPLPMPSPSDPKLPTTVPPTGEIVGSYGVYIRVYDISTREKPVQLREVFLDGSYVSSRLIGEWTYAVVSQPAIYWVDQRQEVVLPTMYVNGKAKGVHATEVRYANTSDVPSSYTIIVGVNIQTVSEEPKYQAVLTGYATAMFVSTSNIYLAMPKGSWWTAEGSTVIHRIAVDGPSIVAKASGEVRGRVLNQYSMDEYQNNFRIATTGSGGITKGQNSANSVYVLSMDMRIIGRLENLAPGEQMYSARFMGDRCYLVTFKKVDPLFTIDLSNPQDPRVLGKLKIPGYSDYLHPYDSNFLIGIGKETVEAEEGDFAWYQGLKISLFDVSDVANPKEAGKIVIGDRGTDSTVLRDPHSMLFDKDRGLLVIPVLEAKIFPEKYPQGVPPYAYGDFVFQGAYVLHVTPADGIDLTGTITHINDAQTYLKSGYYFGAGGEIKRSLYIGEILYTVSDAMIKANSLTDLSEISSIELATI